jgi:hypothetical protein
MMADTRRLPIDLAELCDAMEDGTPEHFWYLDLDTGNLLLSGIDDSGEAEKLIESDPDRFEPVPAIGSDDAYRDMVDFIESVQDRHIAELLGVAISGKGAFRRFKDVLERFPKERESWFHSRDAKLRSRALEWLAEIGVQPT